MALASITSSITSAIGDHGLYAVFFLMLVDAVLPVFSELIMVYAGALAAGAFAGQSVVLFGWTIPTGFWSYLAMALAGTIGYLVGSWLGWGIGVYGGRPFLEKRGRWFHLSPERLDRADAWFEKHGGRAVFIGRITPVVRSFISIPAGVARMDLRPYTLLTLLGSAIWCFALAGVGWGVGTGYERFHEDFRFVDYAVALGLIVLAVWLFVRWRKSRSTTMEDRAPDSVG